MKNALFLLLVFISHSLSSQETRGVTPIPNSELHIPNSTRAVVIGISDYQDPDIPDLRFADKDAEAFADWLRSPAGGNLQEGNLQEGNLQVLLNGKATLGNVVMALTWLYQQSNEGDNAIIYFSGHGDVEKGLFSQPGYLLCYDAPPVVYPSGGALGVNILQEVITTLSLSQKAQILVITDACRAGKLAGSAASGAQLTTANLAKQFAGEVKILSCQPSEFSLEGEQWGGGHGAFSYHLLDGLYGLADRDKDLQIKLKEIGRYLEDHVPADTDPHTQNPLVIGDRETRLATVEPALLAQRQDKKQVERPSFSGGDMRGLAEGILTKADSSIRQLFEAYLAAVEAGYLMAPIGQSANDYFEALIHESSIEEFHGFLKRNFVAALIDEAQQVTNKLLKTDPYAVADASSRPFVFDHIPAYLARAAEILGPGHFFYKYLKAKQYFFEAKTCMPDKFPDLSPDSVARMAAGKFEAALRFDSSAAYAHVEFGFMLFYKLNQPDKALRHAKKALELSPNWVYAHFLAGNCYRFINHEQVIVHLNRAIELDSSFLPSYQMLADLYWLSGEKEKYVYYQNQFIEKVSALIASNPEEATAHYRLRLGAELWRSGRLEEAEKFLLQAEELSKGQDFAVYQYLGAVYIGMGRYEDAIIAAKKQVELAPYNAQGYLQMAGCYTKLNQPLQTVKVLEKAFSSIENLNTDPNLSWLRAMLADGYQKLGREKEAKIQFQKILELIPNPSTPLDFNTIGKAWLGLGDLVAFHKTIAEGLDKFPGDSMMYYQVACLFSLAEQEQKALEWLEKALKAGMDDFSFISSDTDLEFIRDKPGFKALMKKYFPDQVKD